MLLKKNSKINVYIHGSDKVGWSVDMDRSNLENSILQIPECRITRSVFNADIVHNVWWNRLLSKNFDSFFVRYKRNIIATATNFIDLDNEKYVLKRDFDSVEKFAKIWIAPSQKQKQIFEKYSIRTFYHPFSIDIEKFAPKSKADAFSELKIDPSLFEGKITISSFQRDGLGSNPYLPKWQKGPELLIDLLKVLPKDKFILLLVGPRRHYVIAQCKKFGIPYYYYGREMNDDDVGINTISTEMMPFLYALSDIYLITSKSEGGPKAAMEATSMKLFAMSTDVGLARDFIPAEFVFTDMDAYKQKLLWIIENYCQFKMSIRESLERGYHSCRNILCEKSVGTRLLALYRELMQ